MPVGPGVWSPSPGPRKINRALGLWNGITPSALFYSLLRIQTKNQTSNTFKAYFSPVMMITCFSKVSSWRLFQIITKSNTGLTVTFFSPLDQLEDQNHQINLLHYADLRFLSSLKLQTVHGPNVAFQRKAEIGSSVVSLYY